MSTVLVINAVFHDPAAAVVVDGRIVAAAEEERFTRRKHGKSPVPFSTWELPEQSAAWCLEAASCEPADIDLVGYSYDPALAVPPGEDVTSADWEGLRTLYAARAPLFLQAALPGVESQLQSHMRISMNVGLSADQLRHLADVLGERGWPDAARRAREALDRQLAHAAKR